MDGAARRVLLVRLTGQVAAHDAFERQHLGLADEHRPARRAPPGRPQRAARAAISSGSAVTRLPGARSASSWHQNTVMAVSTRPLSGMGSVITTSNAEIRSEATMSSRPVTGVVQLPHLAPVHHRGGAGALPALIGRLPVARRRDRRGRCGLGRRPRPTDRWLGRLDLLQRGRSGGSISRGRR